MRRLAYKAYTDFPFLDRDEIYPVAPLREVMLVDYKEGSDKVTAAFNGETFELELKHVYREPKRANEKPKKIFKTVLRKLANQEPIESVIGVD